MKNRKNIFAALAACVAMVFASCSNLTDANVSSTTENKNLLNVEITNYDDILTDVSLQANTGSRTIIPDSFDSEGVKFYIYGTNTVGGTLAPTEVTFKGKGESKTVGTVDIPAESNLWGFTLVAVPKTSDAPTAADDLTNVVLIGHCDMDMYNGDTAKFTLSPDGLTKPADIKMGLYRVGDWTVPAGYTVKAGIYLLTTGAAVASSVKTVDLSSATADTSAAAYNIDSMDPGTYLFKVTFENTTSNKKFYWSDILIVLPGKDVTNKIGIPNVIGTVPEVPTAFKAGYVLGTEDVVAPNYYTTEFEWTRPTTKNENFYEIDLLELADATDALPSDTNWGDAVTAGGVSTTYGMNFAGSDICVKGSLLTGNTSVKIKLPLGKRYAARIRAVNDAGESAYTYVTLVGTTAGAKEFTSAVINRFRIKYWLNGGTYYNSPSNAESGTGGTTEDIPEYYCQSATTGHEIKDPANEPVKKGEYYCTYWSKDGTSTGKYTTTDKYTGYANLDLYAMFTTDGTVEIDDKNRLEIQAGWITLDTSTTLSGNTLTFDASTGTGKFVITPAAVKGTDGEDLTAFAYEYMTISVDKSGTNHYGATTDYKVGYGVTGAKAAEFTLPALNNGVYQVTFTAHYNGTSVSFPLTLTVVR